MKGEDKQNDTQSAGKTDRQRARREIERANENCGRDLNYANGTYGEVITSD